LWTKADKTASEGWDHEEKKNHPSPPDNIRAQKKKAVGNSHKGSAHKAPQPKQFLLAADEKGMKQKGARERKRRKTRSFNIEFS